MGLAALWLAMMLGGTGPADRSLLELLFSGDRPALRSVAVAVTAFGNAQVLVPVTVIAALWLLYGRRTRTTLLLLATVFIGRALVELQKWGIGRLRPEDRAHLVPVHSLSFPSGHAANSMILFLAAALLVAPKQHRRAAVLAALAGTFALGITRPMLGVHWPSDVIGGWAFGALWVLVVLWFAGRAASQPRIEGRPE